MSSPNLDPLLKLAFKLGEFAALTSISVDYLRDQIKAGRLPARRVSRCLYILKQDGLTWLDSQPHYKPAEEQGETSPEEV